jgi:DNA-binding transcriptional ArsR family regulator
VSGSSEAPVLLGLTERAIEVRRSLEPMAWLVLEELALSLPDTPLRPVGVRSIALALGRSPDAVARALRSLIGDGLVERTSERDEWSGRFGASTYTVDLIGAGLQVPARRASAVAVPPPPPSQVQQQHAHRRSDDERLL